MDRGEAGMMAGSGAVWEAIEYTAMGGVILGVVGEYVAELKWIKKFGHWEHRIAHWSARLVIASLAVEMVATVKTNNINDREIADLTVTAQQAAARAGELGVSVDSLHDFVISKEADISKQFADFQALTAEQSSRNAEAFNQFKADEERLKVARNEALAAAAASSEALTKMNTALNDEKVVRDRLIAATKPRTLDSSRQKSLLAVLKPFAGQRFRAAISSSADDGPAFWVSLHEALQSAGWIYVPPQPGDYTIGRPPAGVPISSIPGVEILFNPGKESQLLPAALALGNALHIDGTVVEVNRDPGLQQDAMLQEVIFIRIGVRPPRQ